MFRQILICVGMAVLLFAFAGCNNGNNPAAPADSSLTTGSSMDRPQSQTHLWGFYTVYIDPVTQTATCNVDRSAEFTANVVSFVNGSPANLAFKVNKTTPGAGFIDVDIDVTISHPFYGLPQYNGYDVRGVFIGDGSGQMVYNSKLKYPQMSDQDMIPDPNDPVGGMYGAPDGYTRWYNPTEFGNPGLCGYTPGLYATPGYKGKATLCPYKYFADNLTQTDDLWIWLDQNQSGHGVFSSGHQNTRNYYLRFPNSKGIKFNYAITANWVSEATHPANANEAIECKVTVTDDVYYLNETWHGGWLLLDVDLFDWGSTLAAGVMDDYIIHVESTVLGSVYEFNTADMTPISSDGQFNTYRLAIPADAVKGMDGNEFWIIVEYPGKNYSNEMGIPNSAQSDSLAAFFRFPLKVSSAPINTPPTCDLLPATAIPAENFSPVPVTFNASGTHDSDPHDTLTYEWDFDGDGVYAESSDDAYIGAPNYPTHLYYANFSGNVSVHVTDGETGEDTCTIPVVVTAHPSKNVALRAGYTALDAAIDPTNGNLFIVYNDQRVYKYLRSSYYDPAASVLFATLPSWLIPKYIDVAPNQYVMIGGAYLSYYTASTVYDPAGLQISYVFVSYNSTACDTVALGPSGSYPNHLCFIYGFTQTGTKYNRVSRYLPPIYNTYINHDYTYTSTYYFGFDRIFYDWVVGVEGDKSGNTLWMVEDQDYYASRWLLQGSPAALVYDNAYFGTGTQTDSDNGFREPKDITRDNNNRLFVLDKLSTGQAKVKVWTVSGNTTTSIGSFGSALTIGGAPLRIEGSDYDGDIVVLHNTASPQMISVFVPIEMP